MIFWEEELWTFLPKELGLYLFSLSSKEIRLTKFILNHLATFNENGKIDFYEDSQGRGSSCSNSYLDSISFSNPPP